MFGFDIGGFVIGTILVSLVVPLVITAVVIFVIIWAVRRSVPTGRDVAIQELRARFAAGQIDQSEYLARMDALSRKN